MVGFPCQRTILDILSSTEVDTHVHNKGPCANVRDRTMHVIVAALDVLVGDGNKARVNAGSGPDVPLDSYLQRFFKYTPCKKDAFIASLIYLDRKITTCGMVIDSSNIHRLFLTCSLTAAKLVEDVTSDCPFNNKLFAVVGGVPLSEMNELELEFLDTMGYRVHIFPCEFHQYSDLVNEKVSILREEYLRCSGLENDAETSNSDESSAHMIYSLIFDSCGGGGRRAQKPARDRAQKLGEDAAGGDTMTSSRHQAQKLREPAPGDDTQKLRDTAAGDRAQKLREPAAVDKAQRSDDEEESRRAGRATWRDDVITYNRHVIPGGRATARRDEACDDYQDDVIKTNDNSDYKARQPAKQQTSREFPEKGNAKNTTNAKNNDSKELVESTSDYVKNMTLNNNSNNNNTNNNNSAKKNKRRRNKKKNNVVLLQ